MYYKGRINAKVSKSGAQRKINKRNIAEYEKTKLNRKMEDRVLGIPSGQLPSNLPLPQVLEGHT